MIGRGNCPLGPLQRRLGDSVPLFELVLPPRAAKATVPMLAGISVAGLALLAFRPASETARDRRHRRVQDRRFATPSRRSTFGWCEYQTVSGIEFRRATPGDADAVAASTRAPASGTPTRPSFLPPSSEFLTLEAPASRFGAGSSPGQGLTLLVAVVDGSPIGHVTVSGHELVHLFVTPAHQGTGLGRRLLTTGEAMITANGYGHLELHARVENVSAIAFYQRAGWTVTDRLIRTVEHGISYDEHILRKQTQNRSASGRQPERRLNETAIHPPGSAGSGAHDAELVALGILQNQEAEVGLIVEHLSAEPDQPVDFTSTLYAPKVEVNAILAVLRLGTRWNQSRGPLPSLGSTSTVGSSSTSATPIDLKRSSSSSS